MTALKKEPAVSPLFQIVDVIVQGKEDDLWGLKPQASSTRLTDISQ